MPTTKVRPPAVIQQRAAGVLLPLSAMPGAPNNGDLTFRHGEKFLHWLVDAGQSYWQVLPLNPIGPGNSPYSSVCSFAGDPMYVSIEDLVDEGLLPRSNLKSLNKYAGNRVNYRGGVNLRSKLLRQAYSAFNPTARYRKFCEQQGQWLEDYALYMAVAKRLKQPAWHLWPSDIAKRKQQAVADLTDSLAEEIRYHKFVQFKFFEQWNRLRRSAKQLGIKIIGDIPIFVSHLSSDVWANQANFLLDSQGKPTFVAGCPPDSFSRNGQLWGNALFDWSHMQKDKFGWWMKRLEQMTAMFDIVRLDHFIGFYRYWAIPARAKTARSGKWRLAKGRELLARYYRKHSSLPFIAEDLGAVTAEVTALREDFNLAAMKVLQLAFVDDENAQGHLPHNYHDPNCVVYTGTHDNDTTTGWYRTGMSKASNPNNFDAERVQGYLSGSRDPAWTMVSDIFKSRAMLAIVPAQDILGLGSTARFNTPGTVGKNWQWRCPPNLFNAKHKNRLRALTDSTGR